jgi:hypothetical protein
MVVMKKPTIEEAFQQLFEPMIEKTVSRLLNEKKDTIVQNPEQLLTITKACKEFGCTQHMLRKAMLNLELPYYQPDNRTYIKRIDVFRFMENQRIRSKDEADEYPFLSESK